ncbi:hypothetical protein PsYK624_090570 [Phanerochaete sordida]|uniref:Uncharacterized protein n=1 Tax=Phanerochaete sordida TaxID=48140 RepID=A0A9P3GFS2_9APHY|nr:hypothetical protein PsYK624_090570 [Phanerochaete sordida]
MAQLKENQFLKRNPGDSPTWLGRRHLRMHLSCRVGNFLGQYSQCNRPWSIRAFRPLDDAVPRLVAVPLSKAEGELQLVAG